MREYDDDHYDDENIRLYTPVLQRVIILAAVIIAVPVMMWTITTFVRSYVARPKVPALEHVASSNMPARIPAISPSPPSPAPSAAEQSAPQRVEGAAASDAASPAAENRNGPPNVASLPDASASPATANGPSGVSLRTAPTQTPSTAITTTATTTGDIPTGSSAALPALPAPRPSPAPRSNDNTASTGAPSSSDRGLAWPNPNTTSPPDFTAPRLPPLPAPAPPARTAAAEVLPAEEPIRGPIPMPRQRPGTFAVAATASGPVPLPRARPAAAPAEAVNTVIVPASGYRPGLDSDR
jgi:hypothetical protein